MVYQPLGFNAERRQQEATARDERLQRERTDRERHRQQVAEHNAKYRAELKRQNDRWEFDRFLKAQRERIAKRLAGTTRRVNAARWGDPHEDRGLFVVTRHGTTEASAPIRRSYLEQES